MQQFLATGHALYVVAAVCGLGVLCKWITRILYKRMIKEAGNMAMTKNRNLKMLKQRVESTYRVNSGVSNMEAYLEHQMYDFKFMGFTLNGWGNFSNQMTFLCFLTGGAAAFLSYWYRSDSYYIVLYGAMGILAGLFTLMVDSGVNLNEKREQLLIALEDYMDNSLFFRPGKGRLAAAEEVQENSRAVGKESLRGRDTGEEPESSDIENVSAARSAAARRSTRRREREAAKETGRSMVFERGRRSRDKDIEEGRDEEFSSSRSYEDEKASRKTGDFPSEERIDYLKHSLEQIAASRDRQKDGAGKDNWLRDLNPQEMRILGDIIKEYLA